jgi:hypothetical protein
MELRFACPTCGQHLSAARAQIGMEAPCPSCNAGVIVPVQSSLPPTLPDFSSQRQQPQQNPQRVKRSTFGVKSFTSVFLAILAAVGVIMLIVFLAIPFVQYNNAIRACLAESHSAAQDAQDATGSPEMRLAQTEADVGRMRKARETLILILENKPWSLPLSHGERTLLSQLKSESRRETASALKNALESYRIVYSDYPQGTPEEKLKALDGENPKHIQFFDFRRAHLELNSAGELLDLWGKPYPLDVTQLEAMVL